MRTSLKCIHLPLLLGLACASNTEGESPSESGPGDDATTASEPAPSANASATPAPAADTEPKPTIAPGAPEDLRATAAASNAFGFDVYQRVRATPGNVVMSPASLSAALSMTYGGARGATAQQMKDVLHLDAEPGAALDRGGQLLLDLSASGPVRLAVANRLFGERTWTFEESFLARTRAAFGAPLAEVDYLNQHEEAREQINAWTQGHTQDLIKDLVPRGGIDQDTRLTLVNAIYFLGDWAEPFPKEATAPRPFRVSAEDTKDVPTMAHSMRLATGTFDGAVAVELPYAGDRFAMTLVMPKEGDGLEAIEQKLGTTFLDGVVGALKPDYVKLLLPKFKVEPRASIELSKPLKALGMVDAFDGRKADFGGIASNRLAISKVFHKGFVRVDEKGTEAAAATAVVMKAESAAVEGREVAFDRPFVFVLRDKKTGLALFVGRVADPS